MRFRLVFIALCLLSLQIFAAQSKPQISAIDRVRLAEAFRLGEQLSDEIWPQWRKAPFATILVTKDFEYLLRHPQPSSDFKFLSEDKLLQTKIYFRPRQLQPNFQATFPAINGSAIPVIVIGQAENTASKISTRWVITMLHEHFHQLQYSQPDYYAFVNSLNLSRGDQTGMWMLNFPFPYQAPELKNLFARLGFMMIEAMQTKDENLFKAKMTAYVTQREKLQAQLQPDESRYLAFQLWQEGVARYTELKLARLAAQKFQPSRSFFQLKDFTSFETVAQDIWADIASELLELNLSENQRTSFYPFGAGEALLMDRLQPRWQEQYFTKKFALEK